MYLCGGGEIETGRSCYEFCVFVLCVWKETDSRGRTVAEG